MGIRTASKGIANPEKLPLAITVDTVYNSAQQQICKTEDGPEFIGDGICCAMNGHNSGASWRP